MPQITERFTLTASQQNKTDHLQIYPLSTLPVLWWCTCSSFPHTSHAKKKIIEHVHVFLTSVSEDKSESILGTSVASKHLIAELIQAQ